MDVGHRLRMAREDQGISLEALADRVKLRPSVLTAIEDDDFSMCGGEVYARGHVQVIASLLGLDADELLAAMRVA